MSENQKTALVVIDLQNDYFPGGSFPLWNTEATLNNVEAALIRARSRNIPVILVQHLADSRKGPAPFFNPGTAGAEIHPRILKAAPEADIVIKTQADSFEQTDLEHILTQKKITNLLLCGMMTQNCVSFTALSKKAEAYRLTLLSDCCTTVNEMIHRFALHALSSRINMAESNGNW